MAPPEAQLLLQQHDVLLNLFIATGLTGAITKTPSHSAAPQLPRGLVCVITKDNASQYFMSNFKTHIWDDRFLEPSAHVHVHIQTTRVMQAFLKKTNIFIKLTLVPFSSVDELSGIFMFIYNSHRSSPPEEITSADVIWVSECACLLPGPGRGSSTGKGCISEAFAKVERHLRWHLVTFRWDGWEAPACLSLGQNVSQLRILALILCRSLSFYRNSLASLILWTSPFFFPANMADLVLERSEGLSVSLKSSVNLASFKKREKAEMEEYGHSCGEQVFLETARSGNIKYTLCNHVCVQKQHQR